MSSPISSIASLAPAAISADPRIRQRRFGFQESVRGRNQPGREPAPKRRIKASSARFRARARSCIRPVLATQRAELAFELFMQVRNKVVSAYQEVMRMQL